MSMKTEWDYTKLADAYMKRPDYVPHAIDQMISKASIGPDSAVADIGAGTGHLTKLLLSRGFSVKAVEPNEAMQRNGRKVTAGQKAEWITGTGENTGLPPESFDLVTFGSSFNTTRREESLRETHRILKPQGWFACMWNHRGLDDAFQQRVEKLIQSLVPEYTYGTRREDQTQVIQDSGLFGPVSYIEACHISTVPSADYVEAWRSHATLERQAKDKFLNVISEIEKLLEGRKDLQIPYTTRLWMAQKRLPN